MTGVPVFAKKDQTLTEYWDHLDKSFLFDEGPNIILEDMLNYEAARYIDLGARAEAGERSNYVSENKKALSGESGMVHSN